MSVTQITNRHLHRTITCKDKQKACKLIVVLGNGTDVFGMPDIELLEILAINCNTLATEVSTEWIRRKSDRWVVLHKQDTGCQITKAMLCKHMWKII